jgi:hypothetical protein
MQITTYLRQGRERLRVLVQDLKAISPLQRRTSNRITACLLLFASVGTASQFTFGYGSRAKVLATVFTLILAVTTLAFIIILGRYLAQETDDFVRGILVNALLCGAACTFAGDMVQSALNAFNANFWDLPSLGTQTMMNIDLFVIGSLFSLAIQLRRNR